MDWNFWIITATVAVFLTGSASANSLTLHPSQPAVAKNEDDAYHVSCLSNSGVRLMWLNPHSKPITEERGFIHVQEASEGANVTGVRLLFEKIEMKDRGQYTCTAHVGGNNVSASFHLTVLRPIEFVDTDSVQEAEEGQEEAVLKCEAQGNPEPKIAWFRDGRQISRDSSHKREGIGDGLVIKNVSLKDRGEYECKAYQLSQLISNVQSQIVYLKVKHKPIMKNDMLNKTYSYVSGEVNLTCEVEAEPSAQFTWTREGDVLEPNENVQIIEEEHRSILQLTVYNQSVFGEYTCIANNSVGTRERAIILVNVSKPGVPSFKIKSSSINSIQLEIHGPQELEYEIINYKVEYKMMQDDWTDSKNIVFERGLPYIITGLSGSTIYKIRVAAGNIAGYGNFAPEQQKQTKGHTADSVTGGSDGVFTVHMNLICLRGIIVAAILVLNL